MRVIHLPDPLFEQRLERGSGGEPGALPAGVAERVEELSLLSGLGVSAGDVVLVARVPLAGELPELLRGVRFECVEDFCGWFGGLTVGERVGWQVQPWGWSEWSAGLVRRLGIRQVVPDPEVVRVVNSREFSASEDVLLSAGGEELFGRLCRSVGEVELFLGELAGSGHEGGWVLKSNFSHAARNRLVGRGEELGERERGWLLRRLERGGCVYGEPWVERLGECGLQWEVVEAEAGGGWRVEFVGAADFLTDQGGEYRGSVLRGGCDRRGRWWESSGAVGVSRRVVERAAGLGFRGPLGIDCMRIRFGGRECVRPVHDVNGRQTMGRLALRLGGQLRGGEWGAWLHFPAESGAMRLISHVQEGHAGLRVVSTSAEVLNARAARLRSWLVIAEDSGKLRCVLSELGCDWRE
jgi:hypothetical protein